MKKLVQEYKGKKITVKYDPKICTHSGHCVRSLPTVFDINKRPWVTVEGAEAEAIKRVIDGCPSGALSYEEPSGGGATSERQVE